jgi:hypothetical protein
MCSLTDGHCFAAMAEPELKVTAEVSAQHMPLENQVFFLASAFFRAAIARLARAAG